MSPGKPSGTVGKIVASVSIVFGFWICMLYASSTPAMAFRLASPFHRVFSRQVSQQRLPAGSPVFRRHASILVSLRSGELVSNEELVQRRIQVSKEKKAARERSIKEVQSRHLHIKQLIEKEGSQDAEYPVNPLYAIKLTVSDDLREELNLNHRERRGRVFVESDSPAARSLAALKYDIHAFFRALRKSTYLLSACLPHVSSDGTILVPENTTDGSFWPIETNEDVVKTFEKADSFFDESSSAMKRPSIIIRLQKDPNAPKQQVPSYLVSMADPSKSPTISMISFYSFPPSGIQDSEEFAVKLRKVWKPFLALGRVYVAKEGINAQMSVPTNVLDNFIECCKSIGELGEYMENGINIDPKAFTQEEFATAGFPLNGKPAPPFRNLHVRVRRQIVADGFDKAFDWQKAGYDMPPLEWHNKLKEAKDMRESPSSETQAQPLIFDCRNTYETDVGIFDGAEPLNTENFRDSWDVLEKRLENVPKDAPIMTYCTGGIRCVKVGAYLTQELGFTNVSRLAGGIIAYDRTLAEKAADEKPLFKGTNFVFDGRLGRSITDDEMGTCMTCGTKTSRVSNCLNSNCNQRMVQCKKCQTSFHGTCSHSCKQRVEKGLSAREQDSSSQVKYNSLDEYTSGLSSPPPSVYHEIELNTQAHLPSGQHMVSGKEQGKLLTQLASMTREGRVLELGTFTGYATVSLFEGAQNVAAVSNKNCGDGCRESGPYVLSLERDSRAFHLAAAHVKAVAEEGFGEAAAESICSLRGEEGNALVPELNEELVSLQSNRACCELLRVNDALASLEAMAEGTSEFEPAPFDLVFVDADKTRLLEYVEACLGSDRVLKKGGLILVDNVLWKGLVLEASSGEFSSLPVDEDETEEIELRKNKRARKLASKMHRFNSAIVEDERADVLVLQMRDGLSMIRKR